MDKRTLRILEYEKIIDMLAAECCSQLTKEAARKLVPSGKLPWIQQELAGTEEAVTVLMKKGAPPLGNFYDISGLVNLAAKEGSLTMKQLLEVAYNLGSAANTRTFLSSDLPELPRIQGLASAISVLSSLENEIKRCIISEDEMSDSASPELRRLRRAIVQQNEAIRTKVQSIVGSSENQAYLQDAIVTMRQGRYVIPVKSENRSRLAGIVHDQSASGATLFIEPQVIVNMNNELRELELAEREEVLRILDELTAMVGREEVRIKANQDILFKLDYLFAKGRLACRMNAVRPEITADAYIEIHKGRHPLIDPKKVVPINVTLGGDYRTLVVTGPNTGGKTVTLKTVGLLCLMAQAGLFVPAGDGTVLPIFKNIYADIGDEQSIEQSLSTFSSHIKNIVDILKGAGKGTLVLLDELGAGTDPTEGAALAISVLDKLYNMGSVIMATTHYTELKKYAISTPGVQNASMEFDVETLSPTYRLTIGVPGKSNAFEISQKLGIQDDILTRARQLLQNDDIAFEDVLTSIEEDQRRAEKDRKEAEQLKADAQREKEKAEESRARLSARREEILEEARAEARAIIDDAQETIKEIQKAVSEAKMQDEAARKALNRQIEEGRRKLRDKKKALSRETETAENPSPPDPDEINIGDRVNVLSVGQKGTILSLPDPRGDMMVQVGILKLSVNISGVTLVQENVTEKQREKVKYSRFAGTKAQTVSMSVNVIGKTLDEAEIIVDKYLDDAFLAGLETVSVIHGRGAGILKNGIAQMLRHNKNVKSFCKADYRDGGDGVTVVTFKR